MGFTIEKVSKWIVQALDGAMGVGYPILYNVIGCVSILLQFLIFQMAHKKHIVFVGILSDIGWISYFFLQGDLISGAASIIGIMSKIIILLREKHRWAESMAWNVFFMVFCSSFN